MYGLKNKVCIVTGGGAGIGKATAILLAELGAKVVIAGRSVDRLKKVAAEIGSSARIAQCDVTDERQVRAAIDSTIKEFGGLDVMVNNAGRSWEVPLEEMTAEIFQESVSVNLMSVFYGILHSIKPMRARGGGAIVSTASACGFLTNTSPLYAHYGSAKAAAIHLTMAAAVELRPHRIRVNAICPGTIDTPLFSEIATKALAEGQDLRAAVGEKQGWLGTPEDCAQAIAFLASDSARFISGVALPVDNALSVKLDA